MSNSTSSELEYLKNILNVFEYYFNIVSSSIGIPCNLVSIIIFARLMRNKTNMGFLYMWQCIIDICVLLYFLFIARSKTMYGINIYNQNEITCRLFNFLRRFILHASSWIAVLTTFDRLTFVLYGHNNRFRFLKNRRNLTLIILAIFTIIAILDIPNLLYRMKKAGLCKPDFVVKFSSDFISILLRTYIPYGLMVIFNAIMVRKIFQKDNSVRSQTALSRKETQFTFAVIASDAYFLLMNFPISVFYILYDVNMYLGALEDMETVFFNKYNLANTVLSDFSFCEQTFTLFLYLVSNKLFRNEFFYLTGKIACIENLSRFRASQSRQISNSLPH